MPLRSNEVRSVRDERIQHITTPLTVSVIGCVVNGPGDARETDIGLTGGGSGTHQVYISGPTEKEGCRFKDKERGQIRQVGEGGAQQQKDRRIVEIPVFDTGSGRGFFGSIMGGLVVGERRGSRERRADIPNAAHLHSIGSPG